MLYIPLSWFIVFSKGEKKDTFSAPFKDLFLKMMFYSVVKIVAGSREKVGLF